MSCACIALPTIQMHSAFCFVPATLVSMPSDALLTAHLLLFAAVHQAGDLVIRLKGSYRHHKKKKNSESFVGAKSICRGDLAKSLLQVTRKRPNINVYFGCSFTNMNADNRRERAVRSVRVITVAQPWAMCVVCF